MSSLKWRVRRLEDTVPRLIEDRFEWGLFTIIFHLLDHLCHDFEEFCSLEILDVPPYEHFHVLLKRAYRRTFMRRATRMQDTVSAMKKTVS